MRIWLGILSIITMGGLMVTASPIGNLSAAAAAQKEDVYSQRDEVNQTFNLGSGTQVQVSGINGTLDIDTNSASAVAQVHIVRTAPTQEDLAHHKIIVEQKNGGLFIHGESEEHSSARVKHQVTLSIPRETNLVVNGVNGHVKVGDLSGQGRLSGVNGKVDLGMGFSKVSGVNGHLNMAIASAAQGLQLSGINGPIDLSIKEGIDANLDVTGVNGSVFTDLPNVTMEGKWSHNNVHAKIGAGGPSISISGINGSVKIHRS